MRVSVLGPTEVRRTADGPPIALRPRERALVAALALRYPSPVLSGELFGDLWAGEPPATARKALQNHVVRVREAAGSDLITTGPAGYALGAGVVIDARRLEERARQAAVARQRGRWQDCLAALEALDDVRRGPAYEDLVDTDAVVGERRRLEELACRIEEDRIDALLALGRAHDALTLAEPGVLREPYRERRWEQLLVARFLVGNRRAAFQVLPLVVTALAEVGLEVTDRLAVLEARALADDRAGLLTTLIESGPSRDDGERADTERFVGRSGERALLLDALHRAGRTSGTVIVHGEAGIGKTALIRQVAATVGAGGGTVAWGSGAAEARLPLAPWVEIVEQALAAHPAAAARLEPSHRQALAGLLRHWPGPEAPGRAPSVEGGRERLVDALTALLTELAKEGPTMVVIDDLHLAPPSTRHLARRLSAAGVPFLLVAAARTADPVQARESTGLVDAELLALGALGAGEVEEYLRGPGEMSVNTDALAWVVAQTGGNPLLVRETTRILANVDGLTGGGRWSPPAAMEPASDALLLTRLDGLAAATVSALQVAAVFGSRFDVAALAELVAGAPQHVRAAVAVGLLVPGTDAGTYEFAHQLIRDAIDRMLADGERLELHEAIGAALLAGPRPALAEVARHHLAAATLDPGRAVASLRAAAADAVAQFAYEDGVDRFAEAVGVVRAHHLGADLACELEIGRGDALRQAGDPTSTGVLLAAAETAEALGAGDLLARAALSLCRLGPTTESGVTDGRAAEVTDRALRVATEPALLAELAGEASLLWSMGGDPGRCRELYEQAEATARKLDDPLVLARVLPHAYLALGGPADLDRRAAIGDEVAELSGAVGDLATAWEAHLLLFSVAVERGDPAAFVSARSARALSDVLREPTRIWETAWIEAAVAHLRGDLVAAETIITASLEAAGAVAPSRVLATYGAQLLAVRIDQGRVGELLGEIGALVEDQPGVVAWRAALALASIGAGQPDAARDALASLWADGDLTLADDFTWSAMAVVAGRAAVAVGTTTMRRDLLAALGPYRDRLAWCGSCSFGPVDTVLGLVHVSVGGVEAGVAAFDRALALSERLGAPAFAAEAGRLARTFGAGRAAPDSPD